VHRRAAARDKWLEFLPPEHHPTCTRGDLPDQRRPVPLSTLRAI